MTVRVSQQVGWQTHERKRTSANLNLFFAKFSVFEKLTQWLI
jgi:hypothetical protein